jgi:hypothetical protein
VNADKLIDNAQVEMVSTSYDSENLLQKLLADYAQILAGEQINSQVPRRWLPIDREVGMGMHPPRPQHCQFHERRLPLAAFSSRVSDHRQCP